jgi:hypothetical protein
MDLQLRVITAHALACLCTAVNANPNPPQHCCRRIEFDITQDLSPEVDLCCEGIAYVTMGDVWPSSASFPEADIVRQVAGSCYPPAWGVQLRLGITRCAPSGLAPTCEEEEVAFLQDLDDSQALRAASCCVRNYILTDPQWLGYNVVIERQVKTIGGGCVDRYAPISIQFPNCDCG